MRHWRGWQAGAIAALLAGGLAATPVHAQDYVIMNPDGGQAEDDGLRIIVGDGRLQIQRKGYYQIYDYFDQGGYTGFLLDVRGAGGIDIACNEVGAYLDCPYQDHVSVDYDIIEWTFADPVLTESGPTVWKAVQQQTVTTPNNTYTLEWELTYEVPQPYVDVRATISAEDPVMGPINLYYATDLAVDLQDFANGFVEEVNGNQLWGAYYDSPAPGAFSGLLENTGTPVTSFYLGLFFCAFQPGPDYGSAANGGCTLGGPGGDTNSYGPPYTARVDSGAGVHWELAATNEPQTVYFRLIYATYEDFAAFDWGSLPNLGSIPDRNDGDAPALCEQLPDMAVSPERIELMPGGTAQIEVALRNLCKDKPFTSADVLLSLNEQLQVAGVPAGWVNLGNRAAWQNLSLAPGETIRAVITVSAPNGVPAAPSHVTELYYQGRAQKRIDGVFITATPAPAAPVPVVEAAPVPVSLPTTLPNTAGPLLPLGALALSGLALAAAGAIGRRLR